MDSVISTIISALVLAALSAAAPTMPPSTTISPVLSLETWQFLRFSDTGAVTADGHGSDMVFVTSIGEGLVRIEAVKAGTKSCFLTYSVNEDGEVTFSGEEPENDNDVFETVETPNGVALRAVNVHSLNAVDGSASGSGAEEENTTEGPVEECFMGFSSPSSEARCYPSAEYAATRLVFVHS